MAEVNQVSAVIKNGEVTNLENNKKATEAKTGYDKDSFLQILVAQMKYQDPMEPTSNTEYISQYATFTQVEQLSNMANAMSLSRASEMVGKTVTITPSAATRTAAYSNILKRYSENRLAWTRPALYPD